VSALRRLLRQRLLVACLMAAVLALKLLVPTGYMIAAEAGQVDIVLCPGTMPAPPPAGHHAMPAMMGAMGQHAATAHDHSEHRDHREHPATQMPCAFAGLSAAVLSAADPVLIVALLAFVMASALGPILLPAPFPSAYLRPPLRGPPARLT
jgi:hypothetical protein